ncbi:DUF6338 family protein [Novipirellula sp.]|uniref:DUF6338 family protein n=1 Tax=Novipirellula sp. TaxID=2795430 RepID=UPI00356B0448
MGIPSSEIVGIIYELLPGFVAAWIFYGLTAHPKTSPFERVIQALIFTLIAEALTQMVGFSCVCVGSLCGKFLIGTWSASIAFVWKVGFSIAIGFAFAWFANTNRLNSWLPASLTKRTSFPSEWFSAFNRTQRFVYLHLHDKRRLYGWPEEWPDAPDQGHFVLMQPAWILPDNTRVELKITERILVSSAEVRFVEFEKDEVAIRENADAVKLESDKMLEFNKDEEDTKERVDE